MKAAASLRRPGASIETTDKWRWIVVSVFVVSSTLNYLDRSLLNTLAPLLMAALHFNQTQFGFLLSGFSIAYAASTLAAGWLMDRIGVSRAISIAIAWWSTAAASTGLVTTFGALAVCRASLGIGESAGVPAVGKLNGMYLKPEERALGAAVNQVGLSLGAAIAPLWIGVAVAYGWRTPFVITGLLGFAWIPLWYFVSRTIPPAHDSETATDGSAPKLSLLKDRNLLILVVANVLWMGGYSIWSNWTTLYLTNVHHISLRESARYVWIPPLVSNLGGFFGGWLSLRWTRRLREPISARRKAVWISVVGSLITLALPGAPNAAWATTFISASFFFALAGSVNIYALPIDLYGPGRSGLAISALTFAFGLLQTVISPIVGYLGDHRLYTQVIWIVTVPLVLSALCLNLIRKPA